MSTNPRCGICGCYHAPRCRATHRMWPSAPLLAVPGVTDRPKPSDVPDLLDDRSADLWAVKLGLHPEQVWPGWCDAALTVSDDLFVNGGGWRQAWEWAEEQKRSDKETAA